MKRISMFLALVVMLMAASTAQAQVKVIVNKSVNVSSLSAAQVKNIYSQTQKSWPGGGAVVLTDMKSDGAAKSAFYKFIGQSPIEMKKLWMKNQLTGAGKSPEMLDGDAAVVSKVTSTPGAIGYVSAGAATGDAKVVATIN